MAREQLSVGDIVSVPEISFLGSVVIDSQLGTIIDLKEPRKGWSRQRLVIVSLDRSHIKQEFYEADIERLAAGGSK